MLLSNIRCSLQLKFDVVWTSVTPNNIKTVFMLHNMCSSCITSGIKADGGKTIDRFIWSIAVDNWKRQRDDHVGYVVSSTVKQEHRVLHAQLESCKLKTKSGAGSVRDNRQKVTAALLSFWSFSSIRELVQSQHVFSNLFFVLQQPNYSTGKLLHFAGLEQRTTLLKSVATLVTPGGIIVTKDQLLADDHHFYKTRADVTCSLTHPQKTKLMIFNMDHGLIQQWPRKGVLCADTVVSLLSHSSD